jgi:hypothetical protein
VVLLNEKLNANLEKMQEVNKSPLNSAERGV